MDIPYMTVKLVPSCEPAAAELAPKHRTHEPAGTIRAVLGAPMPCQIAPTFGNVLATLFEANESPFLAEVGFLVLEQCVGVAVRHRAVETLGHPVTGW